MTETAAAQIDERCGELLQGGSCGDVRALRDEAAAAGDTSQVELCERLLAWQESLSLSPNAADENAARAVAEALCAAIAKAEESS